MFRDLYGKDILCYLRSNTKFYFLLKVLLKTLVSEEFLPISLVGVIESYSQASQHF